MSDTTTETFGFPAIGRKKITAAFDGGRLTSDGGVMLLAAVERDMGIAERFAGLIADPRNPAFITHSVADILRARMLAIACGYEDGDDLDYLRSDPGFKLACGRLPDSGANLCSQPTVSRWLLVAGFLWWENLSEGRQNLGFWRTPANRVEAGFLEAKNDWSPVWTSDSDAIGGGAV
jgi:hypothetical protein